MANPNFVFEEIFSGGGGGDGTQLDTTLTQVGVGAEAKAVGDALAILRGKSIEKVTEFNFASGNNEKAVIETNGIYWENKETEVTVESGDVFSAGKSCHRVPLVTGEGILFEADAVNGVIKVKTDVTKIKEYIEEIFLSGAW